MPEPDPKPDEKPDTKPEGDPPAPTFKAPADQAEFDRMVQDRIRREREKFADHDELRRKAEEFDRLEESKKSELERATGKVSAAEARATKAEQDALRIAVALEKAPDGMPASQISKLAKRLTGATRAELEADAEELFADFAPSTGDEGGGGQRRRPQERLKPGGESTEPDPPEDRKATLDKIPRL